jgi:cellulose biosynthesis protein BcsQ
VVVIPFRGDMQSWHGVESTLELLERVELKARVILLPSLFDMRERLARQYFEKAESLYGKQVAHPIYRHIVVAHMK